MMYELLLTRGCLAVVLELFSIPKCLLQFRHVSPVLEIYTQIRLGTAETRFFVYVCGDVVRCT